MPRKKMSQTKSDVIRITITPQDKAALEAWCEANNTTMSEVARKELKPYIVKGYKLLESFDA